MKKLLFTCIFLILIIFSFLYPAQIIDASKTGILVWFEQILPALLPFTILSTLLLKSNFLKSFSGDGNLLAIGLTMCCGFVFGFPIGAKLASDFYKKNLLTERQATILSITANNFSPMYVCGFVLPTLFSDDHISLGNYVTSTYMLLYLLPLCMAACYLICTLYLNSCLNYKQSFDLSETMKTHDFIKHAPWRKNNFNNKDISAQSNTHNHFQLNMSLLDNSIIDGFQTLIKLCGYIVLFSIFAKITTIFFTEPMIPFTILIANLEITNGVQLLSSCNLTAPNTYFLAIQILSFGGLSGIAQTSSVFGTSGLSIYKYIIGKVTLSLLLTLLAVIYVSYFI